MNVAFDVILSGAKKLCRFWRAPLRPFPFADSGLRLTVLRVAIFLLVGILALAGCSKPASQSPVTSHHAPKYHCAMHPGVVSDKPGDCPICGMRLVPIESGQPAAAATATAPATPRKKTMYRSTMNPNEISDKPGKDSMGMEMVPFDIGEPSAVTPAGLAAVSITPAARERMGLTFGTVEKRAIAREVRTSARIVVDETRLFKVTMKVEGWVDKLFVSVTGQEVKKGDPLLTIYSPDLVSAQQEYLTAMKAKERLSASTSDDAFTGAQSLLAAARRRLQLLDISDEQTEHLAESGAVEKYLMLHSPANGWVTEKDVIAGQKVMAGDSLLVLVDLAHVWGDADIYESDLPYIKVGMPVEVSLPYWPGKTFQGKVSFVSPTLDPESRTLKARLDIENPELLLKPDMYANARLDYQLGEKLAVPADAVMFTGEHTYAFRDGGDGRLIPVDITVGARGDGWYEVLSGLNEGDRVVTSANFLVDSESSMKAALQSLAGK